jgi:uncharacterized repeat protein (TIGR01451 family)
VLVAIGAFIAVAAAIAVAWVANVEPLVRGSTTYGIADPALRVRTHDIDGLGASGMVEDVAARPGTGFTYRISVRNDGPVPVTVTSVGESRPGDVVTRRVVAFKPNPYTGGSTSEGFETFHPFEIAPGAEAGIEIEVRTSSDLCLSDTGDGQTYLSWFTEPITYRILGITRHAVINTGNEIRLIGTEATSGPSCD